MRDGKMRAKLEDFLQEVCEKTITNNQYPVLTSSKSGLFLQSDYFNKQVASKDNTGYKIIRRGQFTYRAMSDTGKFFPNMLECADVGIVSPAYPVFEIIKQDQIVPEYLNYYFKSNRFQNSISTFAQGSTRTSVKFGKLKKVSIELPEIKKQYQIIRTLDLLRTIINNRKKEVLELDELIRARFVEMFESQAWERVRAGTIMLNMRNGVSPSNIGTYPAKVLTLSAITQGGFNPDSWKDGMFDVDPPLEKRVTASDFYMCRGNGNKKLVGVGVYSKEDRYDLIFPDTAIAATIDLHRICLPYLFYAWQQPFVRKQIEAGARTTNGTYKINQGVVSNIELALPPLKLQKQFAAFVAAIDKSKATVQKALDETQLLFDSLMQQYFG